MSDWPERLIDLPGEQKWYWFRLDHARFAAQTAAERRSGAREARLRHRNPRKGLRGAQRLSGAVARRLRRRLVGPPDPRSHPMWSSHEPVPITRERLRRFEREIAVLDERVRRVEER